MLIARNSPRARPPYGGRYGPLKRWKDSEMGKRHFTELLRSQWDGGKFACVGLDSDLGRIYEFMRCANVKQTICVFNRAIVEATKDFVCAFKPNIAFYEPHGAEGIEALRQTIEDIHEMAPDVPVILDAKRADIGNTNGGYVQAAFDFLGADAITVHPYLGVEAMKPFLDLEDKGIIVLCRTSNKGAGEFQDLIVDGVPLYCHVAQNVARTWNRSGNCALVVGATYPGELARVRKIVGDIPILIPGIGAQGGDLEATVAAGQDSLGQGMIINSSRGIIFASKAMDFAQVARGKAQELHDGITRYRAARGNREGIERSS